jgi:hypothetical protein
MFAYLNRSSLVFDPQPFENDPCWFTQQDWSQFYPSAAEPNMREPRGNDHAGCHVTRRSHTGIRLFLQRAPVIWYSIHQNTVEASTFGSEFISMKTALAQVQSLCYKLQMMGIPINGQTSSVYMDNQSVFKNATSPEYVLKKKHNSSAYCWTREAQAPSNRVQFAWELSDTNILNKLMPGPRLRKLVRMILY